MSGWKESGSPDATLFMATLCFGGSPSGPRLAYMREGAAQRTGIRATREISIRELGLEGVAKIKMA
jgi:hypothetical protein